MSPRGVLLIRLSVVANVLFAALAIAWLARRQAKARESRATEDAYAAERRSVLGALPRREGATLFLGDSLTERGEWAELFGDAAIQNRGVAGDTTAGVLARAREAAAQRPARVFLMVGVNDLFAGEPVAAIAGRYAEIVDVLRAAAPGARLYCQSVLPIRAREPSPSSTNAEVRSLNEAIARI